MDKPTLTLFHGTSDVNQAEIERTGLKEPFATTSVELAEYYAGCACDETGGKPVIFQFEAELAECSPDLNALIEPVVYGVDDIAFSTSDEALESINSHPGPLDTQASIDLVASVLLQQDVSAQRLHILK